MLSTKKVPLALLKQALHLLCLASLLLVLQIKPLHAAEPFVVKDIRVEGLQRVEPGTVFSYLPVQVGERLRMKKLLSQLRLCMPLAFLGTYKFKPKAMS